MLPGIEMMNLVRKYVWSEKAKQKEEVDIILGFKEKFNTDEIIRLRERGLI